MYNPTIKKMELSDVKMLQQCNKIYKHILQSVSIVSFRDY